MTSIPASAHVPLLTHPGAVPGAAPEGGGIDAAIEGVMGPIASWLTDVVFFAVPVGGAELPILVVWLFVAATFLTVWLKFQPLRGLMHSVELARGKFGRRSDPGQVTSFQALATELSGTVGLGNIAGVAVAITVGGPGATFWIIIAGFLGMSVKMSEATLGVRYRKAKADGTIAGGPMYYLRDGLAERGLPRLGKVLALLYSAFAVVGTIGAGNLFQANQATAQLVNATGGADGPLAGRGWLVGLAMAIVAGIVILGGLQSIAAWTSRLTPVMGITYVVSVLAVLVVNAPNLGHAAQLIVEGAFTGRGVAGGAVGVAIVGIQRALFSNAAGVGTAAMAHAAVKTRHPATEGFVAMWEPLIDSVVICTMTGLAIVVTGQHEVTTDDGISLTSAAFSSVAGWFPIILTVAVVLFAFSTVLSYAYYGETAAAFLFGEGRRTELVFRCVWIVSIVLGSAMSLESVIGISDAAFFCMSVPNLLGVYLLAKVLREEILGHRDAVASGERQQAPDHQQVGMLNPVAVPLPADDGVADADGVWNDVLDQRSGHEDGADADGSHLAARG